MSLLSLSSIIAALIPAMVLMVAQILAMRSARDREKSSPFECGFDPKVSARIPFSTRFFLLAIIFIVFDIEIVLLMPVPLTALVASSKSAALATALFLIILIIGLVHEWKEGSLDWPS